MTGLNSTSVHTMPDLLATRAGVYLLAAAKTAICAVIVRLPLNQWPRWSAVVRRCWPGFCDA